MARAASALCSVLMVVALPAAAQAQAWQCRLPARIAPPPAETPGGPVRAVPVAGYTLALSWSPEFCRTRKGDPAHETQCGGGIGRFGFILHGLWPEGTGAPPQWCPSRIAPSAETIRRNLCMTPSPALIAHEWAKHGTCMAATPDRYFRDAQRLFGRLRFPDMGLLSRKDGLTAGDLRRALVERNPALRGYAIRLRANRAGWLTEAHVCYGRTFRPQRCRDAGLADAAPLSIWRSF